MQGDYHLLRSEKSARDWLDYLIVNWDWKQPIAVKSELNIGTRTLAQNAAMHKHFKQISDGLNELGLTQAVVMEKFKAIEKPWSEHDVKEYLYHRMMKALTNKTSTADLNKTEVSEIDHQLDMWFANNFPEFKYPSFPHKELLKNE